MQLLARPAVLTGAIVFIAFILPSGALGQSGLVTGLCRDDVERFCPEGKDSPGGVAECLRSHVNELDPECRKDLAEREDRLRERLATATAACSDELARFCADQPDYKKVPCLRMNHAELSEGCQAVVRPPKPMEE